MSITAYPDGGYIKLWRKSLRSGMLCNASLWAFWCWCLLSAAHKPTKIMVGFQEIVLDPGQLICSRSKVAKELKMSQQTVRTCIFTLINSKNITIKSTNKYSIISIINWGIYQSTDSNTNQQNNHQDTCDLQKSYQQILDVAHQESEINKDGCEYLKQDKISLLTSNQPATNQQPTSNQPATIHINPNSCDEKKDDEKYLKSPSLQKSTTYKNKEYIKEIDTLLTSGIYAGARTRDICPVDAILDLFHGICISLPRVASWNGTGKRSMVKRWTESKDRQSLEWWEAYFRRIESSDFLTGRKTDFVASLNWIVGPVNMEKILNGQYDNNRNGVKGVPQSKTYYHNLAAIAQAKAEIMGECDETN